MWTKVTEIVLLVGLVTPESFNNEWSTHIPGGVEAAKKVEEDTGCQLQYEIIPGENLYLFLCHHVRRRSTEPHEETHKTIEEHEYVSQTEQQKVKSRNRRQWGMGFGGGNQYGGGMELQQQQQWRMPQQQTPAIDPNTPYEDKKHLNDQRWPLMWYLNRGDKLDMNVQDAWEMGITGKGIVITILDDGIEKANPDLVANYDPEASYDVNQNDNDPTPRYDLIDSNRHGTRCAGEVSATANNSVCGVGIAYDSRIGGVRMLDGDVTDAVEARSLSLNNQHIDIYSASWGPDDDGKTVDGPGNLASRAFITGVANGRSGKGSIFVWASGNGGRDHDNCNCDGYTNSIWTLSVSSATENGLIPWYSEACSSTMATTYSSGSSGERKVITTDLHNGCTSSHTGTSASAPMAAGVIALVLEAAPTLGWRDVQHITVRNCHVANLRATDWRVNSVGRNYSHSFGYGIMDTSGMVRMAQTWKNVGPQVTSAVKAAIGPVSIPAMSSRSAKMEVTDHGDVNFLEHVQAHVTIDSSRRGDLAIYLTSPQGTKSQLLARRPHDSSRAGFHDWPFLTVFSWGENPAGTWELEVQNDGRYEVTLRAWSMTFHGTTDSPDQTIVIPVPVSVPSLSPSPSPKPYVAPVAPAIPKVAPEIPKVAPESGAYIAPIPSPAPPVENCVSLARPGWCAACEVGFRTLAGRCVKECPSQGLYEGVSNNSAACLDCYYSCRTCSGPNDYECISCYGDAELDESSSLGKYCHNKTLVFKIFSSSRWYYILSIGFIINFIIVVVLVMYILRWRRAKAGKTSLLDRVKNSTSRYSPVASKGLTGKTGSTLPFHDYEESSDEAEDFMKPYSDEPSASTFLKPYTDDE
eukprot:GFUD01036357.1.p1 GENE.GFUD01036357.1~~GFUD01036357.1.p1  ORF type:complete len:862 (-),score=191.63 GFUD01036357.1:334-2919(-)